MANEKQRLQDLREINHLEKELSKTVKDNYTLTERMSSGVETQLSNYKKLIAAGKEAWKNGKISVEYLKSQVKVMNDLLGKDQDLVAMREKIKTLIGSEVQGYRKLLENERLLLVIDKPLTRSLPELYEENDDFLINSKIITKHNLRNLK